MFALIGLGLLIGLALFLLFKPETPTPPTPAQNKLDVPKVAEGETIGRVYGCYWLTDAQAAWFGDEAMTPIKKSGGGKK